MKTDIFQDGTSQTDRMPKALKPEYVSVNERSAADLIRFAKNYSENLQFFNELNKPAGNWSSLFDFDDTECEELSAFMENPEAFKDDNEKFKKYSSPHLALFLTFLKLLEHPQKQFDNLTGRHLDFYYKNILQFKEKPETPDRVHVILNPEKSANEYLVKKGTLLNAGKDSQGNDLHYAVESDIVINNAQVAKVATLHAVKVDISLKNIHEQYERTDKGFEKMLCHAIGSPNQDDPLPLFPDKKGGLREVTISFLKESLYTKIKEDEKTKLSNIEQDYILNSLCFPNIQNFRKCMEIHDRHINKDKRNVAPPSEAEWTWVYEIIEKAYRKKITQHRRKALQEINETYGLNKMMEHALGDPLSGNPLSIMPAGFNSLESLYNGIDNPEVKQYIIEQLFMSDKNFESIMMRALLSKQDKKDETENAISWDDVYILVEKAQTRKRNFSYPPIGKKEIQNISAQSVFELKKEGDSVRKRYKAFGSGTDSDETDQTSPHSYSLGFAAASPVLFLQDGDREINLTVSCKNGTLHADQIQEMLHSKIPLFNVYLSSNDGWLKTETASFRMGDFIVEKELKKYGRNDLTLICVSAAKSFTNDDLSKYLVFEDGSVYEIVRYQNKGMVYIRSAGTVPADKTIKLYTRIVPEGDPQKIGELSLADDRQQIQSVQEDFNETDIGAFVTLPDSSIYIINKFIDANNVIVTYRGRVAGVNACLKYSSLKLGKKFRHVPDIKITQIEANSSDIVFTDNDLEKLIVWDNGNLMTITGKAEDNLVNINITGRVTPSGTIMKYSPEAVYCNALQFKIFLGRELPPVQPFIDDEIPVKTSCPAIKIMLNDAENANQKTFSLYERFKSIRIEKAGIHVKVKALQDIRLRNDNGTLNAKSPFEPFGGNPATGGGFYFALPEICEKKLNSLTLDFEWMGLPDDFAKYYGAYAACFPERFSEDNETISNQSFKTQLKLLCAKNWIDIDSPRPLFCGEQMYQDFDKQETKVDQMASGQTPDDLFELSRYFKMELCHPDLLHDLYPLVQNKTALKNTRAIAEDPTAEIDMQTVNSPYTPKVKNISLSYTASDEISFNILENVSDDKYFLELFHIHPFGAVNIFESETQKLAHNTDMKKNIFLMPQYNEEGYLYIGIKELTPPQHLFILFQVISGSGDPDIKPPEIRWRYLSKNKWQDFEKTQILSDSTNGLLNSGIINLSIPDDAFCDNTLLSQNLYWLRATTLNNTAAISDIIDIRTQAVCAVYKNIGNAADHLSSPLPANTIKSLAKNDSSVREVIQPYSSFNGRMREDRSAFYTRASERLRHKHRAVTQWDYERLILERFPQIYKAKCIRNIDFYNIDDHNDIIIVVIPDISNTSPFLPLEPKATVNQLEEIKRYIQKYTSPFVKIDVRNPRYEQIQYRLAVKFKKGYDQGYYLKQLNEDMVRFLSPWAYELEADISFGSSIHISTVADFIENRPYVDYITKLKLIEQKFVGERIQDSAAHQLEIMESSLARVRYPDSILVSSPLHIIDHIETDSYDEEQFEGIGYMIIGSDFIIRPPGQSTDHIGHMTIEKDFKIY